MIADRSGDDRDREETPVHSTRRTIAGVIAGWLVPGLGHVMVGRVKRGLFFAALIFGCFGLGLAHDGKVSLRDGEQPFLSTLQLVANAGIGVADPIVRVSVYGAPIYFLPGNRTHPAHEERVEIMRTRARSDVSIYGSAYLWTAGLMNLLLLFDVWDIGRGRRL